MKSKFQKVAGQLRPMIPDVDDPLWNVYRNMGDNSTPIDIPIRFFKDNEEIAYATFRTLPSSHQLMWLALYKVLEEVPDLDWDSVTINNSGKFSKSYVEDIFKEEEHINSLANKASKSVYGAMHDFAEAVAVLNGTGANLANGYNEIKAGFVSSICLLAHEIKWHTGGPPKRTFFQKLRAL